MFLRFGNSRYLWQYILASVGVLEKQFISADLIFMHGLFLAHVDDAGMVLKDFSMGDGHDCEI